MFGCRPNVRGHRGDEIKDATGSVAQRLRVGRAVRRQLDSRRDFQTSLAAGNRFAALLLVWNLNAVDESLCFAMQVCIALLSTMVVDNRKAGLLTYWMPAIESIRFEQQGAL
jgi:hypothetical protein